MIFIHLLLWHILDEVLRERTIVVPQVPIETEGHTQDLRAYCRLTTLARTSTRLLLSRTERDRATGPEDEWTITLAFATVSAIVSTMCKGDVDLDWWTVEGHRVPLERRESVLSNQKKKHT
jgi:hypothetical protein